jgi:hypothetical protein
MRKINEIILHCSATSKKSITAKTIRQWHLDRGWSDIGYHFFIRSNGLIEFGRPLNKAGAHCRGHNRYSIGICLNGLKERDFSLTQLMSLRLLLLILKLVFKKVKVYPHNKFNRYKTCPVFDCTEFCDK